MHQQLDLAAVRRSILQRQGLIEGFNEPLEAVRAMVAVQTQYAASLPVAVATRLKKGKPGWDDKALEPGGELIKSWSLRHTLHAHTREDHALVVGSLAPHLYSVYLSFMERRKSMTTMQEIEAKILDALQERPLTRRELHDQVPELKTIEGVGWGLDVMGLAVQRRLCIVGRGAEQKFCTLKEEAVEPSFSELLRRYLASYSPATKADFAHWTGLKTPNVKKAFEQLGSEVVTVEVTGKPGNRYSLRDLAIEATNEPLEVRLLAKFDPLVLAHKDKSLFIAPEHRTKVFRIAGQVEAVVLIEGVAAATWRLDRKGCIAIFSVEPFRKLGKREEARIQKEASRLAKSLGHKSAEVQFV